MIYITVPDTDGNLVTINTAYIVAVKAFDGNTRIYLDHSLMTYQITTLSEREIYSILTGDEHALTSRPD